MGAKGGWRIEVNKNNAFDVTFFSEGGDIFTLEGFASRAECAYFFALYLSLMGSNKGDKATDLLQDFISKQRH